MITFNNYFDALIKGSAGIGVLVFGWIFKKIDSRLTSLESTAISKNDRILILEESRKHHHTQMNLITGQLLEINKLIHEIRDKTNSRTRG